MLIHEMSVDDRLVLELPDGRLVTLRVTEIRHLAGRQSRVRVGTVAPRDVLVHRSEIWEAIQHACHAQQLAGRDTAADPLSDAAPGPAAVPATTGAAQAPEGGAAPEARWAS